MASAFIFKWMDTPIHLWIGNTCLKSLKHCWELFHEVHMEEFLSIYYRLYVLQNCSKQFYVKRDAKFLLLAFLFHFPFSSFLLDTFFTSHFPSFMFYFTLFSITMLFFFAAYSTGNALISFSGFNSNRIFLFFQMMNTEKSCAIFQYIVGEKAFLWTGQLYSIPATEADWMMIGTGACPKNILKILYSLQLTKCSFQYVPSRKEQDLSV